MFREVLEPLPRLPLAIQSLLKHLRCAPKRKYKVERKTTVKTTARAAPKTIKTAFVKVLSECKFNEPISAIFSVKDASYATYWKKSRRLPFASSVNIKLERGDNH